jgi:hypothetical protein
MTSNKHVCHEIRYTFYNSNPSFRYVVHDTGYPDRSFIVFLTHQSKNLRSKDYVLISEKN